MTQCQHTLFGQLPGRGPVRRSKRAAPPSDPMMAAASRPTAVPAPPPVLPHSGTDTSRAGARKAQVARRLTEVETVIMKIIHAAGEPTLHKVPGKDEFTVTGGATIFEIHLRSTDAGRYLKECAVTGPLNWLRGVPRNKGKANEAKRPVVAIKDSGLRRPNPGSKVPAIVWKLTDDGKVELRTRLAEMEASAQ